MAADGWIRRDRTAQRTSTGAWHPKDAWDTPEAHGIQTQLDFKSATMALADHMERWWAPATSAARQAVRDEEIAAICGPAYPVFDRDDTASEQVAAKKYKWQHATTTLTLPITACTATSHHKDDWSGYGKVTTATSASSKASLPTASTSIACWTRRGTTAT